MQEFFPVFLHLLSRTQLGNLAQYTQYSHDLHEDVSSQLVVFITQSARTGKGFTVCCIVSAAQDKKAAMRDDISFLDSVNVKHLRAFEAFHLI